FVDTNPRHKLAQLRAFGGLSGSEYETTAGPHFFERYLAAPGFNDTRDFLLAYELQKRYFRRGGVAQIEEVRATAVRIPNADPKFKPLRDAIHNQISPALIPQLNAYADGLPKGSLRSQVDQLIVELSKLTAIDERALSGQVHGIQDAPQRERLTGFLPTPRTDPVEAMMSLGQLMVAAREAVANRSVTPADARRLIDLNITAATAMQAR